MSDKVEVKGVEDKKQEDKMKQLDKVIENLMEKSNCACESTQYSLVH